MKYLSSLLLAMVLLVDPVLAQMIRPPAFSGGIPGSAQFQAIQMQRHQARTLLYQEALEELRRNPAAADVAECPPGLPNQGGLCLGRPVSPVVAKSSPAESAEQSEAAAIPRQSRRLAILFGNNDYRMPIPKLETPIADVEKIAATLRSRFGYDALVIRNASKAQIVEALNGIAANAKESDSVLLFYAGHGYLMEDIDMGFWIPVDGSVKTANNWVSNKDISKLLAAIRARQLILVSDSCFSGSLSREQKIDYEQMQKLEDVLRKRSVLVLSSGGDEPVSDEGVEGHSIFAWSLIKTLDSVSGTTPGQEVWRKVRRQVSKDYSQEPQYGAVLSAGHTEGGEYLFQPR